jgi:hypothetical protein
VKEREREREREDEREEGKKEGRERKSIPITRCMKTYL